MIIAPHTNGTNMVIPLKQLLTEDEALKLEEAMRILRNGRGFRQLQ